MFPITVVFAKHWTRIGFQTIYHVINLVHWGRPLKMTPFSMSREKMYTFSDECENILLVSNSAQ